MKNGVNRHGFSLVEMMVVLAIIGILTLLTVPRYLKAKPGYLARGVVSQVARDLNKVKMRAIETRRLARVTFNSSGYTVEDGKRAMNSDPTDPTEWGRWEEDGTWADESLEEQYVAEKDFSNYPGVYLSVIPPDPIEFSPRGTGTTGLITATHDDYGSIDIAINLTGGVDVRW